MAKVSGAAAYQQLRVPQDGIGQAMQFWGAQQARRGEEDRARAEREGVRKQQADEKFYSQFQNLAPQFKTGNQTEDDIAFQIFNDLRVKHGELVRASQEARNQGNLQDAYNLQMRANSMVSETNNLNKQLESIKTVVDDFVSNPDKYNEYDTDAIELLDAVSENRAIPYWDKESGKLKMVMQLDGNLDSDMDGVVTEEEKQTAVNMVRTNPKMFKVRDIGLNDIPKALAGAYKKYDITGDKGMVAEIAGNIGNVSVDDVQGLYQLKRSGWAPEGMSQSLKDAREKSLDDYATMMTNDAEKFASVYNLGMGNKDNPRLAYQNDDKRGEAKEWLKQKVRDFYETETSEKFLTGKANYLKDDKEKKKTEPFAIMTDIQTDDLYQMFDKFPYTSGMVLGDRFKTKQDVENSFSFNIEGGKPVKNIIVGEPNTSVKAVTVFPDGDVFLQVEKEDVVEEGAVQVDPSEVRGGRQVKKFKVEPRRATEDDLGVLAQRYKIGEGTANDMYNYLLEKKQNYLNTKDDTTTTQTTSTPSSGGASRFNK